MSIATREIIIGVVLVLFGAGFLFYLIPVGVPVPQSLPHGAVSPALWPSIVSAAVVALGALVILQGLTLRRRMLATAPMAAAKDGDAADPELFGSVKLPFAVAGLVGYWAAIPVVGLPLSSALALVFFVTLLGERRIWMIAFVAIVLPTLLYYFFTGIANIPITLGLLFD